MNRAQYIREVFQPSDDRPIPDYITRRRRRSSQMFTYNMELPGGVYQITLVYVFARQELRLLFTKDGSTEALFLSNEGTDLRTHQEIIQDKQDLIHVFRALVQMIIGIRQMHMVHTLFFSSKNTRDSRVKFYDRFARMLTRHFRGDLTIDVVGNQTRYTIENIS